MQVQEVKGACPLEEPGQQGGEPTCEVRLGPATDMGGHVVTAATRQVALQWAEVYHLCSKQLHHPQRVKMTREGDYMVVVTPAYDAESPPMCDGLCMLMKDGASWEEAITGRAMMEELQDMAGGVEGGVRQWAVKELLERGYPAKLAGLFADALTSMWGNRHGLAKRGSPSKARLPSQLSLRGAQPARSGAGGEGGREEAEPASPKFKQVGRGDDQVARVMSTAAMLASPQLEENLARWARVEQLTEDQKYGLMGAALAHVPVALQVGVVALVNVHYPGGMTAAVTPVFVKAVVELALKVVKTFMEMVSVDPKHGWASHMGKRDLFEQQSLLIEEIHRFLGGQPAGPAIAHIFEEAFGGSFTVKKMYAADVGAVAGNLGAMMAATRNLLMERVLTAWQEQELQKRKVLDTEAWKRGFWASQEGGGGPRGQARSAAGKFQSGAGPREEPKQEGPYKGHDYTMGQSGRGPQGLTAGQQPETCSGMCLCPYTWPTRWSCSTRLKRMETSGCAGFPRWEGHVGWGTASGCTHSPSRSGRTC